MATERTVTQTIDDGETITVIATDEDGNQSVATETYGSSYYRDAAIERTTEKALNK
jgi:C4-type Zn-finger protein